jgi:hypothetical protein
MLRNIHNMSRGEAEPEYNNRQERRAADARKRRKKKRKFPKPNLTRK